MYAGIDELIKYTKPHNNLIIMEDFNAIVDEGRDGSKIGHLFVLGKRNAKREHLVELCRKNRLIVTYTIFKHMYMKHRSLMIP